MDQAASGAMSSHHKVFSELRTKADFSLELILSSIRHHDEMPQEFLQRPRPATGHSGVTVELQQEAVAWTSGSVTSPRETVPTFRHSRATVLSQRQQSRVETQAGGKAEMSAQDTGVPWASQPAAGHFPLGIFSAPSGSASFA